MNIFIIAALTADGFIAKTDNQISTTWTSKADKEYFKKLTKKAGTVVMGSKTFETIGKALPDRRTIVLSRNRKFEGVETTSESPKELVDRLRGEGVQELAVCGGASIYAAFMEAGIVDSLFITIEPVLFGTGVTLFNREIKNRLELKSTIEIGDGAVVLEYKVI